jgi:hypothetical protein
MQPFSKSPLFVAGLAGLLMSFSAGCQCSPFTNCVFNVVDDVSDHQGCMDPFYCACFDLTRIGYADWRACRCNRIWCHNCAEKHDCDCESYHSGYYGSVSTYQPGATTVEENAELPPLPAADDTLPPVPPEPEPEEDSR